MFRLQSILAFALLLAACGGGGGGGGPTGNTPGTKDCNGSPIPVAQDCPAGGNGGTEGNDDAGDENGNDGDDGNETEGGPTPGPTPPGPTSTGPTSTGPTPSPPNTARGTYESLRDRILAAANPAALAETLDDATLTENQYDALFELALVLDPGTPETDRQTARRIVETDSWPALDQDVADREIDLTGGNPALDRLHAAHRAELVTREAAHSAFLAVNTRADVPGDLVPVADPLGSGLPPNADELYYGVWMDTGGTIHRWQNRAADVIYTAGEIQAIPPAQRTGADGATASFRGQASGFAAHTDGTAGEMTADVALTVAFGIDNTDDDRFDVAPSLTGTIDGFRLVGQTGDLGWTATIDGDLGDDGTVAPGDIATGKPPYLVRNVNDLSVAFSTDRVTGQPGRTTPYKRPPPRPTPPGRSTSPSPTAAPWAPSPSGGSNRARPAYPAKKPVSRKKPTAAFCKTPRGEGHP